MGLTRQWVTADGSEYLVLAGTEGAVLQEIESRDSALWSASQLGFLALPYRWFRRTVGRGRVEVRRRDEAWAWETPDKNAAYHVANLVEDLLTSGTWVPERMPQPRVEGAEVAPVYH